MGCFNVKCGLSGLDIVAGDPVVLLLGRRVKDSSTYCGGWEGQQHHLQLLATPIFGKYNDYGWIENLDQNSWDVAMECLMTMGVIEEPLDEEDWFEDNFLQHCWDKEDGEQGQNLLAWVHRRVWDSLVASGETPQHHFINIDTTGYFKVEDLLNKAKELGVCTKGHTTLYDNRYQGRDYHWISLNPKTSDMFKICNWMYQNYQEAEKGFALQLAETTQRFLKDLEKVSDQNTPEEITDLAEQLAYSSLKRGSYAGCPDNPFGYIVRFKLGWFFPWMFRNYKKEENLKAHKFLKLSEDHSDLFVQAASALQALNSGHLVIRPHVDMVSSGQCLDKEVNEIAINVLTSSLNLLYERRREIAENDDDLDFEEEGIEGGD